MDDQTLGAYNIADLRDMARRNMPRGVFAYLERGTEEEVTLRKNREAFEHIRFKPRLLVDVSKRNLATTVFGKPVKMPVMIGPTGFAGLCAYEGDILLARAAAVAGVPYVLGAAAVTAMEKVVERGGGGRLWFQIHMFPDRRMSHAVIDRARETGFEALVVTVDGPVSPNREHNKRIGMTTPFTLRPSNMMRVLHPRWIPNVVLPYLIRQGSMPNHDNYPWELRRKITSEAIPQYRTKEKIDSLTWDDLRDVRKKWSQPLIVKGILCAREAILAADCGADGIVISNHGGRVLDGAVATMEVLPEIVDAVGNRLTVMIDSGFRRGSDVVKALALGAKMVLLGRAPLYGLTAAGEAGALRALGIFNEETERVMALLGCSSVAELSPDLLFRDTLPDHL